jgi:hypothetical protein
MDNKIKWYYEDGVVKTRPTLFGYRRRNVLLLAGAGILCLIALIVGLAVGLTLKKQSEPYHPLLKERLIVAVKTYRCQGIQEAFILEI